MQCRFSRPRCRIWSQIRNCVSVWIKIQSSLGLHPDFDVADLRVVRTIRTAAIAALLAGIALLAGLVGSALKTGRIDPLDWLLPSTAAIIGLTLLAGTGAARSIVVAGDGLSERPKWVIGAASWLVVTLPVVVLIGNAGGRAPWVGMVLLALILALVAGICGLARGWSRKGRSIAFGAVVLLSILAPHLVPRDDPWDVQDPADMPVVAVSTALPLQGVALGAAQRLPPAESFGLRSPLWQLLEKKVKLHPIDSIGRDELTGVDVLFLAQPRLLAPLELVALDDWVRAGGWIVILADPLLHWPDPRALADPGRAPLTSLLDPLLAHWGLRLESAELEMGGDGDVHGAEASDRWVLESGALLQLSGASRFVLLGSPSCSLAEEGLVARCSIGRGQAVLVADADWIDDMLWTLSPEAPEDRRYWTSDAPAVLAAWLRGDAEEVSSWTAWISERDALLQAVRGALLLILILSVGWAAVVGFPPFPHRRIGTIGIQNENKDQTTGHLG
jgi:hypothetical protein